MDRPFQRARGFTALLGVAVAAGLSGCGDDPTGVTPTPTEIEVSPATETLTALAETVQLSATVRDQNGNVMGDVEVAWSSDDPSVVSVNGSTGLAQAEAVGSTNVTATSGEASGSATIQVTQEPADVQVEPARDTLVVGDQVQLSAIALDANGHRIEGASATWSSSDPSVVEVDEAGLATAMDRGNVEISATVEDATGSATLESLGIVVTLDVDSTALAPDGTATLTATAEDDLGRTIDSPEFAWSSSDESVVTVDQSGTLTPQTDTGGEGLVTVELQGFADTATVRVLTPSEAPALELSEDAAVAGFVAAVTTVPTLADELTDVEDAMSRGNLDAARSELTELRTLLDDALTSATGEERVLLVAIDLVVDAMELALQV